MEALQNLLTFAIEFVAIAGFGGIVLHAIWKHHTNWMKTYCPPIAAYTPDTRAHSRLESPDIPSQLEKVTGIPVIEEDVWEGEVEPNKVVCFRPVSRHFSPQLALPPVKEETKQPTKNSRKTPAKTKAPAKSRTRKRKAA